MPRTLECDYCGDDIEPGRGTMFVYTDGTTVNYCSAKCEKNADLGREPRDLEWTAQGRAAGGATETPTEPDSAEEPTLDEGEEVADAEPEDEAAPDLEAAEGSEELDEPEPADETGQPEAPADEPADAEVDPDEEPPDARTGDETPAQGEGESAEDDEE